MNPHAHGWVAGQRPQPTPAAANRFVAGWDGAWLGLSIAPPAPRRCAAEAALGLARAETLLAALDRWLPEAPDWQWAAECDGAAASLGGDAGDAGDGATANWKLPASDPDLAVDVNGTLSLPWRLMRRAGPPPPELASVLAWQHQSACCVLAAPRLDATELATLEPGGALLLWPSMAPRWAGQLRASGEAAGEGLEVVFSRPDEAVALTPAAPAMADAAQLEVQRFSRVDLPAEVLAGWCALSPGSTPAWNDELQLWQTSPGGPGHVRARGRLMPWGRGHAMLIERIGS